MIFNIFPFSTRSLTSLHDLNLFSYLINHKQKYKDTINGDVDDSSIFPKVVLKGQSVATIITPFCVPYRQDGMSFFKFNVVLAGFLTEFAIYF